MTKLNGIILLLSVLASQWLLASEKFDCDYIQQNCRYGVKQLPYFVDDPTEFYCNDLKGWRYILGEKNEVQVMADGSLYHLTKESIFLGKVFSDPIRKNDIASSILLSQISKNILLLEVNVADREYGFSNLYLVNLNTKKKKLITDTGGNHRVHYFLNENKISILNLHKCHEKSDLYEFYNLKSGELIIKKGKDCSSLKSKMKNKELKFKRFSKIYKKNKKGRSIQDIIQVKDVTCKKFMELNKFILNK